MLNKFIPKTVLIVSMFIVTIPNAFAAFITHTVTVQPIIVSDNDGSNTATFFGDLAQKNAIESQIDTIWGQAGIDVNFLSANVWNNSFANSGSSAPRPTSDLSAIVNDGELAGVTHSNADYINIFFVNIAAGFSSLDLNTAAGLAYLGDNGITQYVGSNLLGFSDGRDVIASVVAHEIGHNLNLDHTANGIANLMSPGGTDDSLTADQISTALDSRFAITAVPLPAGVWLLGSGLIGLISFSRRKV